MASTTGPDAAERATAAFRERWGRAPAFVVRAPGRVNLIGEHTDYNDGFVLPMPLPFQTVIAAEPVPDRQVEVHSEGFGSSSFAAADDPSEREGWARYVHGMAALLSDEGLGLGGWRGTVATDIPAGAGLSSSAAIEVASGLAFVTAGGAEITDAVRSAVAAAGTRVENELFGLPSGVMDQLASATANDGGALLIDCGSIQARPVPVPAGATIVVLDTGTRRQLVGSAFADRRASCERAAKLLGAASLREIAADDPRIGELADGELAGRVRHVASENERVLATVDALRAGDLGGAGRLMAASHRSLREDYEVSSPALDAIVAAAEAAPGCYGARMTGGGFAGCAVALVDSARVDDFVSSVLDRYRPPAEQPATEAPRLYPVQAGTGAVVS